VSIKVNKMGKAEEIERLGTALEGVHALFDMTEEEVKWLLDTIPDSKEKYQQFLQDVVSYVLQIKGD